MQVDPHGNHFAGGLLRAGLLELQGASSDREIVHVDCASITPASASQFTPPRHSSI